MLSKARKTNRASTVEDNKRTHPSLDLSRTVMAEHFTFKARPWTALDKLQSRICERGIELPYDSYDEIAESIWVHQSAYLSPHAKLTAPVIICGGAKICHYSHVECSVIGSFSQISEFSVIKNSIIFDKTKICGHNSINSSILGYESEIGEGATIPDSLPDGLNVSFEMPEGVYVSSKARLGSVICDGAIIGASCVVNPGSVIDLNAKVSPLSLVSGYFPPYSTK